MTWTRESVYWFTAFTAVTAFVWLTLHNSTWVPLFMGLIDTALFNKIERFRGHGLTIDAAVDLAADQHQLDPEELAIEHFSRKLEELDPHDNATPTP